jgi:hypothetical protein
LAQALPQVAGFCPTMITTVSFMPYSRSARQRWLPVLASFALALACVLVSPWGHAEGISPVSAKVELVDDSYQLDAQFDIRFSPRLEEAVNRGVALYFVVEFELAKPRWYWFDEKPVQLSQTYKVTYTPLLRQYRLSVGSAYQNFRRFEDIVRALSRVRGWTVAGRGTLQKEVDYQASLRMRLDTAQLPKPFQLNAVASRDWNLTSEWHRWIVNP